MADELNPKNSAEPRSPLKAPGGKLKVGEKAATDPAGGLGNGATMVITTEDPIEIQFLGVEDFQPPKRIYAEGKWTPISDSLENLEQRATGTELATQIILKVVFDPDNYGDIVDNAGKNDCGIVLTMGDTGVYTLTGGISKVSVDEFGADEVLSAEITIEVDAGWTYLYTPPA